MKTPTTAKRSQRKLIHMNSENFINPSILNRAYITEMRPDEICWKLKDIKDGISELDRLGKKIGGISIYFKIDDGVYCPQWGDWLELREGNKEYLQLFNDIDINEEVNIQLIFNLIARFGLIISNDYDWEEDLLNLKNEVPSELAKYDLNEMYFALNI